MGITFLQKFVFKKSWKMFKFFLASASMLQASSDVGIPPGAVLESSMGSGDIPVDFTEEELEEIETLEFSISADLSLPIMDAWASDFEDTNSLLYNARATDMIDFFEPHIAAELENNAAEFSSVQVRFTNECRSEVCLDTSAHMAYEFTVSGGDVVDLIDSSRSGSLDTTALAASLEKSVVAAVTSAAKTAIASSDGSLVPADAAITVSSSSNAAPCESKNSDGCCKGIRVIGHGVSGLSDPLNLELGTDGIYATGDSTHTLQVINGLTQLVKSDDLTNVLCYAKNRNTCMDRDVAYSCFKTAKIRGFASRWQNNYDMKVECVNMC